MDDERRLAGTRGGRVVGGDVAQRQRGSVEGLAAAGVSLASPCSSQEAAGQAREGATEGGGGRRRPVRPRRRRRRQEGGPRRARGGPDARAVERVHLAPLRMQQQAPRVPQALLVAAQIQ